jgi:hypothetical protein
VETRLVLNAFFSNIRRPLCKRANKEKTKQRVKKAKEAQKQSPATPEEFLLFRDTTKKRHSPKFALPFRVCFEHSPSFTERENVGITGVV